MAKFDKIIPNKMRPYVLNTNVEVAEGLATTKDGYSVGYKLSNWDNIKEVLYESFLGQWLFFRDRDFHDSLGRIF